MANRSKYKLETDIKFVKGGVEERGEIEAIVTRATGYSYLIKGSEVEVAESAVLAAYRMLKPRTAVKAKIKKVKKLTSNGPQQRMSLEVPQANSQSATT